eukprot:m.38066 g.38066  ORF g.38066 m.38066 type:complete len:139 (-) comp11150_c0_seq1:2637-3053(-)
MASASDDGVTTPPLPRSLSIPTSPSPSDSPAKQQLPRGSVARIVLTGGPCGGKTTAQSRLSDLFENLGWKVMGWIGALQRPGHGTQAHVGSTLLFPSPGLPRPRNGDRLAGRRCDVQRTFSTASGRFSGKPAQGDDDH